MTKWALVENEEVKELHDLLPKNWRHVSGLNLSENDIGFLNSLGWYKIESQEEQFDSVKFRILGHDFIFENNRVIAKIKLHEITEEEILKNNQQIYYNQLIHLEQQKKERNLRLQQSDWSVLPDVIEKNGQEWYEKWKQYRQSLRDLPQNHTDGNFIWPEVPN